MATPIHPTAIVHPQAEVGTGCEVGPYCVIGPDVRLEDGCRLQEHVVLAGHTNIGPRCEFYPFACLGKRSQDLKYKGGTCYLEIGSDNVFRECVTAQPSSTAGHSTRIGSHNHFLAYAHIAHDSVVGNHVVFSNNGTLGGHVTVEDYAVVGGLAAVHQFCRIGMMAMIGGCSKVVQDVAPFMIVDGNPATTHGVNKIGLERHGVAEEVQRALREAYRIVFKSGLTLANALDRLRTEVPPSKEIEHFIDFCRQTERGITR